MFLFQKYLNLEPQNNVLTLTRFHRSFLLRFQHFFLMWLSSLKKARKCNVWSKSKTSSPKELNQGWLPYKKQSVHSSPLMTFFCPLNTTLAGTPSLILYQCPCGLSVSTAALRLLPLTRSSSAFLLSYWAERLGEWWAWLWPWADLCSRCCTGVWPQGGERGGERDTLNTTHSHTPDTQRCPSGCKRCRGLQVTLDSHICFRLLVSAYLSLNLRLLGSFFAS